MKKTATGPKTLEALIPEYGEMKSKVDELDKVAKKQNKSIKELMSKLLKKDATEIAREVGGWIATYQVRSSQSYNEEALLEFVKKHKLLKECVETKEVINEDKLESILYRLSEKDSKKIALELDKFRIIKKTEYLYIKKKED